MGASQIPADVSHNPLKQSVTHTQSHIRTQQNIENEEPSMNLSHKINSNFKKQYTASKNIMNCKINKQLIIKSNRHKRYQQLIQTPTDTTFASNVIMDKMMIPIYQAINRIRVNIPEFKMIEVDQKQFILMKETSIFNDYELIKQIGKGSFGSVYKAKQKKTNQIRAVKKINKQNLNYLEKIGLINEFEILRRLDHPNIIKLYEMYDENYCIYVVTELCEGGNLLDFVTQSKTISEDDIRGIMQQLLGAVRYLHDHSILHRDIKLENIVLIKRKNAASKQKIEIKLIDFGISIDLIKNPEIQTSTPMGTLLYMSPQSIRSKITLASDIYSCGIVLYIMTTKRIPFIYKSEEQLMHKIEHGDIIRKNLSTLTLDLKLFLVRLLEKNYKKRLTAVVAIQNLWLTKAPYSSNLTQTKRIKVAQQIFAYDAKNNLISLIQGFLVCKMINQQQRQRLAKLFAEIDVDKSGVIEIQEFKKFYYQNSEHYDSNQIEQLGNLLDKNNSGNIQFNQFITAMYCRRKLFQLESLQMAFDFLDKDKSGEISKNELQDILKGVQFEEIQYLFQELDKNRDQRICKREFLEYFRRFL